MSKPICIRSERFARSAGLLASLVNRPGRYSRLFWRVYRNEVGLLDKSLPNWRNLSRMITWLIDEGAKPAIYDPSEQPNTRWEVHIRPQDLCVCALTTYVALLICWVIRVRTVWELSYNAQTQSYLYFGSLSTYCGTPCWRTQQPVDVLRRSLTTYPMTCRQSAAPKRQASAPNLKHKQKG